MTGPEPDLAAERRRQAVEQLAAMCSRDYDRAAEAAVAAGEREPGREAFVDAWIERTDEVVAEAADDSRWM